MKSKIVPFSMLTDKDGRSNWTPAYYIPEVAQADVDESVKKTKKQLRQAQRRLGKLEALATRIQVKVDADEPIGNEIREEMLKLGVGVQR
jgi:hypothetical protein